MSSSDKWSVPECLRRLFVELIALSSNLRFALAILAGAALFSGCGSSSVDHVDSGANAGIQFRPKVEMSYPAWFWSTPVSGDAVAAVGYSETFARPEVSEQHAIEDGLKSLAKSLSVRIRGEFGVMREGARDVLSGDDIQEEVSAETEAFVKENHHVAAKFISPEQTLVLLSLGQQGDSETESSAGSTKIPEKPDWVTILPAEPGYLYGLGESNLYYRESNSWRSAEENARLSLALNIESRVKGLSRKLEEGARVESDSTVIVVGTDVQLSRAQIVARWKDNKYGVCHVLIRMAVSANFD